MSDLWSAKVLGRWLTKNPPKTKEEKIAPLATFITNYCSEASETQSVLSDANSFDIVNLAARSAESAHPSSRLRADQIHLTEPRIQRALGCIDTKAVSCAKYIGTQGPIGPAIRTENLEETKAVK